MSIDLRKRLDAISIDGVKVINDATGKRVNGKRLAELIVDGTLDLALGEASQITVTFADDDGYLAKNTRLKADVRWGTVPFTVATVTHAPQDGALVTTVIARSAGWQTLKRTRRADPWRGLSPSQVVTAECKKAGLRSVAQPTAVKKSIAAVSDGGGSKTASVLDVFTRLAGEQGFIVCETGGTVFFGAPSWLVKRAGWKVSGDKGFLLEHPTLTRTIDDKDTPARVTLSLAGERPEEVLLPCSPVQLADVPRPWLGRYLVERVTIPFGAADPATVELVTPVDPEKQK